MDLDQKQEQINETMSMNSTVIAASWNSAQEELLCAIADRSNCSRWMHSKCQALFDKYNFWLTIPSIAISSLVGSLTMSLPSLTDATSGNTATTALGLIGIGVGVLASINQYMKSAQLAESHRAAAVAYGKLHRTIQSELAIRRDQRIFALDFLKIVKSEQDRLQDTSPIIVDSIITLFRKEFATNTELEKPEVAGDLDHVTVNRSSKPPSEHLQLMLLKSASSSGSRSPKLPESCSNLPLSPKVLSSVNSLAESSPTVKIRIPDSEIYDSINEHLLRGTL